MSEATTNPKCPRTGCDGEMLPWQGHYDPSTRLRCTRCGEFRPAGWTGDATAPVPRCICWLGTDATCGDSRLRQRCPVHGDNAPAPPTGATPLSEAEEAKFRKRPDVYLIPRLLATLDARTRERDAERARREAVESEARAVAHNAWLAAKEAPRA